jgi:uncharacterized protein (TIGR02996 family)
MSDRDALLAAVLSAPDDDLPRLVFADYLEESGHPADAARAQFIRLQIEAERHPRRSPHRRTMLDRAELLRPSFRDEWDRVFQPGDLPGTAVARRRGFVDEVRTNLSELCESGNVMFAIAPIRTLQLGGSTRVLPTGTEWADLAGMEFLGRLAVLRIGPQCPEFGTVPPADNYRPSPVVVFLRSPHLRVLHRLNLSGNGLVDTWTVLFTRGVSGAGFAESLLELDLSDNRFTDATAHTLHATAWLDRLNRLVLTGNRLTPHGTAMLRQRFGERVVL